DGQASSPQQIPVGQRGRYVRVQLEAASQLLALAEVEVWAARPSACNAAAYRNAYSTMAFDLLQKDLLRLTPNAQYVFPKPDLQRALTHINEWYWRTRANSYPGTNPDSQIWTSLTQILGGFWARLDTKSFVAPDGVTPTTLDVFGRGMMVNQAVLDAALDPDSQVRPLIGAPLAELLGQAFKTIHERLQENIAYHEVSCRLLPCQNGQLKTEVSEL